MGLGRRLLGISAVVLFVPIHSPAYAVFTHEALIDLSWQDIIRPMLLQRYPKLSEAELREAHAYAYGGCVIQDLGYYPFGKKLFSDLTHYVRTGEFVAALFRSARTANEYAFAVGALSHYVGDSLGHSQVVNRATVMTFPKLEKRFGPQVAYEDATIDHLRVEFGFDVAQMAWRRYAPTAYHERIGFRVARRCLDKAFFETYGLKIRSVLGPQRSALGSYAYAVRGLLPEIARAFVVVNRGKQPVETPDPARQRFLSTVAKAEFTVQWGNTYENPGVGAHLLAILIRVVPKIGPLRILSIRPPTTATEDMFLRGFDHTQDVFRNTLLRLDGAPSPALADLDLDTGERVKPGGYRRTDQTYAKLLERITAQPAQSVPPGLREDILTYYSDLDAPFDTKKHRKDWKKLLSRLEQLRESAQTTATAAPLP